MINAIQEAQWAYLLDPCFELSNSAGKPLTGGYIEVYIHGTRTKYYCASDFDGTLHPFQIPLDSLGANIVLAAPGQAYDVYVYNKFGSLVMSRYNVNPVGAGKGGSSFDIESTDGSVIVTETINPDTGVKTYDLSVPTASAQASYWVGVDDAIQGHEINDTNVHVLPISQTALNHQGEDITVNSECKFSLKKGVYFWTVNVDLYSDNPLNTYQQVYVYSSLNRAAYKMDMTRDNMHSISFSGITTAPVDGTLEYFSIETEGQPIRATIYQASIHRLNQNVLGQGGGTEYTPGQYISIEDDVISVTGLQPAGDYATEEQVTSLIQEAITGIQPGQALTPGQYISIDGNTISVTGLQPVGNYATEEWVTSQHYATETYVDNSVTGFVNESAVTALIDSAVSGKADKSEIPSLDGYATEAWVTSQGYLTEVPEGYATESWVTSQNYATETYVDNSVSSFLNESQVTAIVESAVSGKADKSEIPSLDGYATEQWVTSQGYLTEVPEGYATEQWVTSQGYLTEVPEGYATEEWVTSQNYATETYVDNSVSSFLNESQVTAIVESAVSGKADKSEIPSLDGYATESWVTSQGYLTTQVQSDWAATGVNEPDYIKNKPEETLLIEGRGINIDETASGIEISCTVTSLDGYATEAWVTSQGYLTEQVQSDWNVTATNNPAYIQNKPETEEVQFEEIDLDDFARVSAIPSLDGYATEQFVTAYVEEMVSAVTGIGDYGEFYSTDISTGAVMSKIKGSIELTNDGKIKLKQGQSYHVTVRGRYNQATPSNDIGSIGFVEYITSNTINVNVDNSVTGSQYFEISYDLYKLNTDINYAVAFSGLAGKVNDLYMDIHAIGSVGVGGGGGGSGVEYDQGWGIRILNHVISVNPDIIATVTGVNALIQSVTGTIPSLDGYATESWVTGQGYLKEIPDGYATESWVTGQGYLKNQVQSDWTEDDDSDPAYILNKPEEKFITAGDGINITESATGIRIDCTVTGGGGGAQVQSDWAVTAISNPAYIKNKPTEKNLVPGANVTITESSDEVTIETTEIASGLQLVAGKGVRLTVSGTNIVAATDETVLWESTTGFKYGDTDIQLSEPMSHFERIVFINGKGQGWSIYTGPEVTDFIILPYAYYQGVTSGTMEHITVVLTDGQSTFSFAGALRYKGNTNISISSSGSLTRTNNINNGTSRIYKVIGVNRISS